MGAPFHTTELPLSPADREAAAAQLERMLAHALFRNSKRYAPFLRHVVERALSGEGRDLKERTVGMEVFGRSPDYDTNSDPVVRVTAGEIRKRIAQYYFEPGHESEFRIELPPGSYMPEFRRTAPAATPATSPSDSHAFRVWSTPKSEPILAEAAEASSNIRHSEEKHGGFESHDRQDKPSHELRDKALWFMVLPLVLLAGGLVGNRLPQRNDALDKFWSPILQSSASVMVTVSTMCRADFAQIRTHDLPAIAIGEGEPCEGLVNLSDASALASVSGVLGSKGRDYEVRQARVTNYSDLQTHPTVLIGGLNNPWTLRLCSKLRFCFRFDDENTLSEIVDNKRPGTVWSIPKQWRQVPKGQLTQDYGLISRVFDPTTEQFVVIAAGIGTYGTVASGEFLSKAKYVDLIAKQAPKDWAKKNLQIVISTQVINGDPGPPHIVAAEFW